MVSKGKVARIYATIDPNTHRSRIRCTVADPGRELRPGMLASLSIRVQDPQRSTAVPADAVVREGDGTMITWVTADRRHFRQMQVRPGLRQDGRVQILSGLEPGQLVVAQGGVFLSNLLQAPPLD